MRIISVNTNGIRAANRKGFFEWLETQNADVVCIQETKAQKHQLTDPAFSPAGYHCYYFDAHKPGYSGVAVFSKKAPLSVTEGLGFEVADTEGRYLQLDFEHLSVASLYLPSGSSKESRQLVKYDFMAAFEKKLKACQKSTRECVICGDWNIAHKQIDIKNWRANQKHSGFLPEEREWLDKLFGKMKWVDAFRVVNQLPDQYTWWSNFGRAWDKNVGWRIDYQVITPGLKDKVTSTSIYKDQRFSDHAPLIVDYDYSL
jgi:exodeoxyribonuclease III